MANDNTPEYDFYAPRTPPPTQSPFGSGFGSSGFGAPQPSRFGSPAAQPFASPTAVEPSGVATPQRQYTGQQFAPPPRRRTPVWVMVLAGAAGCLVVLVVLGILAAVAIPVFLNQRKMAESTEAGRSASAVTVTLPDVIDGLAPIDTATEDELVAQMTPHMGDPDHTYVRMYGGPERLIMVMAVAPSAPLSDGDQQDARNDFLDTFIEGKERPVLTAYDSGASGGWFGCADTPDENVCISTDQGSMLVVVDSRRGPLGIDLARAVREATVIER